MMKHLRSKSKAIVALVLVLTIAVTLVALPAVSAQPTKKTYAYIGAVPNPVGKGQQVLLHIGITDYLTIATDGWEGLWVSIEKPDNTTEKIENIKTDSTAEQAGHTRLTKKAHTICRRTSLNRCTTGPLLQFLTPPSAVL